MNGSSLTLQRCTSKLTLDSRSECNGPWLFHACLPRSTLLIASAALRDGDVDASNRTAGL